MLLALNQLLKRNCPAKSWPKLRIDHRIGRSVFYFSNRPRYARAVARSSRPVKLTGQLSILLLKPDFGVSTHGPISVGRIRATFPVSSYLQQDFRGQKLYNELERPVFEKFVFLGRIKMWLLEQKEVAAALMSGSGSTVFAVLRQNADVDLVSKRAKAQLDPKLWTCAVETRGVDRPTGR